MPLEHNYIGLAEIPSTEGSDKFSERSNGLNLKATELRLGLPGSESPERDAGLEEKNVYPLGMLKSLVSAGAKRGFSDAIDGGSGKWVISGNGGSEVSLAKDGGLFSPRGVTSGKAPPGHEGNNQKTGLAASVVKDSIPQSPKPMNEKKPQISAPAAKYYYPQSISLFSLFTLGNEEQVVLKFILCFKLLCSLSKYLFTLHVDVTSSMNFYNYLVLYMVLYFCSCGAHRNWMQKDDFVDSSVWSNWGVETLEE